MVLIFGVSGAVVAPREQRPRLAAQVPLQIVGDDEPRHRVEMRAFGESHRAHEVLHAGKAGEAMVEPHHLPEPPRTGSQGRNFIDRHGLGEPCVALALGPRIGLRAPCLVGQPLARRSIALSAGAKLAPEHMRLVEDDRSPVRAEALAGSLDRQHGSQRSDLAAEISGNGLNIRIGERMCRPDEIHDATPSGSAPAEARAMDADG